MAPGRLTRRRFLQSCVAGTSNTVLAGCSGLVGPPQFRSGYVSYRDQPVVEGGPTPNTGPPLFATVLTSRTDARNRMNWNAFPETEVNDWRDVDYSEFFVAVFISQYVITPPGAVKGGCPLGRPTGDTFTFSLGYDQWPPMAGKQVFTLLQKWQLNGSNPPEQATIELTFNGEQSEHSCTD